MNYIVQSGPTIEDDLGRLEKVLQLADADSKIVVSGIGPDLNKRLHQETEKGDQVPFYGMNGLDVHDELWNESLNNLRFFGVDTQATTSEGNLLYSFQEGVDGDWTIVSRPLHLLKFKLIEKRLRDEEKLASGLKLNYKSSGYEGNFIKKTKDILYDSISILKEYINRS